MKDRRWFTVGGVAALLLSGLAVATPRTAKRGSSPFVQTDGNSFTVNGSKFRYVGTNSYWLPVLNTEQDIWNTLGNISAIGAKVVRVWAFNDVATTPSNGTWFQLVQNGTVSINDGPNGLQKLDTVVQMAQQHGLYVTLTLTNNWYPSASNSTGSSLQSRGGTTEVTLPRNYLSNDYGNRSVVGGMDLYVHQFGLQYHDQFYTDQTILNAFQNFTSQVVSRYVNSPAIFSWELANDPRCGSTFPTSGSCTTETITEWHATMAQYIRSIDPNHLISSGTQGFMCTDCPKLYPLSPTPTPQPSPAPGSKKRSGPVTTEQLLRVSTGEAAKLAGKLKEDGIRVRGRWTATATRRQQAPEVGSASDGSYGVDSQDIMNIPDINFGTFQLFPDQDSYAPNDPSLSSYQNVVNSGVDWITNQAQSANAVGKPLVMTSIWFADFVPFNMTIAPYASDTSYGVTNQQQTDAYSTWLNTSVSLNLAGMIQYQWGQQNLTAEAGTVISPGVTGITLSSRQVTSSSQSSDTTGYTPNDGYSAISNQNDITGVMSQIVLVISNNEAPNNSD
ncbi:glycoside hydrolase family 5 protein [Pisolithus sp. B1]|nr:glycoside hydrolase family 5 protein [Pisolithus sp. B1]